MKRILISGILIGIFIMTGTIAAILYANGYRLSLNGGTGNVKFIEGTGLLVATSRPDSAKVLINDKLTTATNNTINLAPGVYNVKIQKDGYVSWEKKIIIKKGFVSEASVLLFPTTPKLEAVTTIGISNLVMDATQTLLAFTVASSSAAKNGIYSLDMSARTLIFLGDTGTQLVSDVPDNFSQSELSFSPNGKEILAKLPSGTYYLLDSRASGQTPENVTNSLPVVNQDWAQQRVERDKKIMGSLGSKLTPVARMYFKDMTPSPENDKILYTASSSGTLAPVARPAPSVNSTPDQRNVKAGSVYVYDIKEDKNYEIGDGSNKYFWHADDRHLVYAKSGRVNIVEFDGGNLTTVYDGPFADSLVFPWPDGSGIGILTRLSSNVPYNLYRIGLQ